MQADQPPRIVERRGNILEFQRGRVRCHYGTRLDLGFEIGKQLLLDVEPLNDGFDNDVGAGNAFAFRIGNEASACGVVQRFGLELAAKEFALRLHAFFELFGADVLQRDFHAGGNTHARDIGTHRAGADNVNTLRFPAKTLGRLCFQKLGQAKHAAQIARSVRYHERCEGFGLGHFQGIEIAAVLFKEIDEAIGRRIMVLARFFRHFPAHPLGEERTRRLFGEKCLEQAGRLGFSILQHGLARRPAEFPRACDKLIKKSECLRSTRPDHAARQHVLHGGDWTHLLD